MVEAVRITEQHVVRNYLDIVEPFAPNGWFSQEQFILATGDTVKRLEDLGLLSRIDEESIKREFDNWVDTGYVKRENLTYPDQDNGSNNPLWRVNNFNLPIARVFNDALQEANASLSGINSYALRGVLHDAIIEAAYKHSIAFIA